MNAGGSGSHGWAPTNIVNLYGGDGGVCARTGVCVRACMRMRACVHHVFAIYDNNI